MTEMEELIREDEELAAKRYERNAEDTNKRYLFEPDIHDVVDWLSDLDDETIYEFLDDLDKRVRENKGATIYVMLADWLDDHYAEIREFINR